LAGKFFRCYAKVSYKKLALVEEHFANLKQNGSGSKHKVISRQDKELKNKVLALEQQTHDFGKDLEKYNAAQKILASLPQSVNQEIRKLSALESDFSNLKTEFNSVQEKLKAGAQNPGLLKARPVIEDGIRAAQIFTNLKQAALLFQEAAVILKNSNDPQNTVAEQKLIQISKELSQAYMPDVNQINSQFDKLVTKVESLAFLGDKSKSKDLPKPKMREDKSGKSGINELAASIWSDVRSLVKISKDQSDYTAVTSNEARAALRAVLRLKLEQTRLMAQTANQQGFDKNLKLARQFTEKAFDNASQEVVDFLNMLDQVAGIKVVAQNVGSQLETAREILK